MYGRESVLPLSNPSGATNCLLFVVHVVVVVGLKLWLNVVAFVVMFFVKKFC